MKTALFWFIYTITTISTYLAVYISSEVNLDNWSHQFRISMIWLIKKNQPYILKWLDISVFEG